MTIVTNLADVQRAVEAAYADIPHTITVAESMAMPWGGHRNLALRKALGMPVNSGEVCMVNQGDVVQVVTLRRSDARRHAGKLEAALPAGWTVAQTRRPDGRWLVTAHQQDGS